MTTETDLARALAPYVQPLSLGMNDFDSVLDVVGHSRCVLIGEATHGSHDFYRQRAQLTKRLILEKGFHAVAAEADWPDAYRVNRYVRGLAGDMSATEALGNFQRFPAWMWRNADVLDFIGWLRDHNDGLPPALRVGFYGLDLYSLRGSVAAVLAYLEKSDPGAAERARRRYACFDHFGDDEDYGLKTSLGISADCERAVVEQLLELQERRTDELRSASVSDAEELFQAEQNARVVKNAEEYYRAMFQGSVASWNLRDRHMGDTLDCLLDHLPGHPEGSKIVVWAHNSHIGDARATELGTEGEHNLGQLARARHPGEAILIGLTTYEGTVTAASDWGQLPERKPVRPALPESSEAVFHELGLPAFVLRTADVCGEAQSFLEQSRLQRAIGVVYKPETERRSHYFHGSLAHQFDVIIHIDHTRALEPIDTVVTAPRVEAPETFPSGF